METTNATKRPAPTYTIHCENACAGTSFDITVEGLANARRLAKAHRDEHKNHSAEIYNARGEMIDQYMH